MTFDEFITGVVKTLSVTGVTRQYEGPPASLNNADLPASFPEDYQFTQEPLTFKAHGGMMTFYCTFTIACEPAGLGTNLTNFNQTVTIGNNLDGALRAALATIGQGSLKWDIRSGVRAGPISVAGNDYWGIRCSIEAKGHGGA